MSLPKAFLIEYGHEADPTMKRRLCVVAKDAITALTYWEKIKGPNEFLFTLHCPTEPVHIAE